MATQPVVDPVKMPKVQADNKVIATVNAVSMTLATFMGWMTIWAAIASFTKKGWGVGIPFAGLLLGANASYLGTIFACGLLTVLFAVIGLITARKITDINAMKDSWKCARNFFILVAAIEVVKMISLAIYSLCGIGEKSGVEQGYLWLNGFLSNSLAALAATGIAFIAHAIANGKTAVLSVMRFVALGVAAVACILVFVSTIVNFYNKKSSSSYSSSDYSSILDLLK
jgi:hypothetical protein